MTSAALIKKKISRSYSFLGVFLGCFGSVLVGCWFAVVVFALFWRHLVFLLSPILQYVGIANQRQNVLMTVWASSAHGMSPKKRGSFLKTWSANDNSDDMISVIFEVEEGFDIPLWIERVPTQSNPSDVLSREVVSVFEGAERVRVNSREIWKSLVKWSAMVVTPEPRTGEKARLWGWVSPQIPHFQKEKRVRLLARVHGSWFVAHKLHGS